jgi:hypothetical protein
MTAAKCRFPTLDGLCSQPVSASGERCSEHQGLDAVSAAAALARRRGGAAAAEKERRRREATGAVPDVAMSDVQIAAVAECLNRHQVDYVLVGGAASQLHGASIPRTRDADIVPSQRQDNLDRLAAALDEMGARLWVGPSEPEGVPMRFDRHSLGQVQRFLNLVTSHGPLDITYRPEGTDGYDDLIRSTVIVRLLEVDVPVAALRDVIRSKEAAGRAKDLAVLPKLIEHLKHSEGP